MTRIEHLSADHPDARSLIDAYLSELALRLGGFEMTPSERADASEMELPVGTFVVVYDNDEPVACGGLKTFQAGVGEIKRVFVSPKSRRRGHAKRVLLALEEAAKNLGQGRIVLDTADPLREAAALYLANGYREISAYNDNPYAARWFTKDL